MPLPNLESFDALLDGYCSDILGDTIGYSQNGGETVTLKAFANHRDGERTFDSAKVIEQDMSIQILASLLPSKPTAADRVTLPKIAGQMFKPIAIRRDDSGNYWEFELKAVNA